jgi:hypothetical protein
MDIEEVQAKGIVSNKTIGISQILRKIWSFRCKRHLEHQTGNTGKELLQIIL